MIANVKNIACLAAWVTGFRSSDRSGPLLIHSCAFSTCLYLLFWISILYTSSLCSGLRSPPIASEPQLRLKFRFALKITVRRDKSPEAGEDFRPHKSA